MISISQIQTSAKKHGVRIGSLKCKILKYIHDFKKAKATDLDKAFSFSAGRRANDLEHKGLLEVLQTDSIINGGNERFYYSLTDLGRKIMTDASMQTEANQEKLTLT